MMLANFLVVVGSFALSLALTWTFVRYGAALRLVDIPAARKVHTTPIPKGGGLAIFAAALCLPFIPGLAPLPTDALSFWLACGGIVTLGLLDDLWQLPWWSRLPVQAGLALWMARSTQTPLDLALELFWIVGLINAFNMIDNMDAQSAGVAWLAALALGLALLLQPGPVARQSQPAWPYLYLLGATAGFLCFNWPPARVFMGDAGSTLLGFFLAVRCWHDGFMQPGSDAQLSSGQMRLATLTILAFPWYDLCTVVGIRLSQGHSPFHPDKQHLAHRLTDQGLSKPAAVRVIHLLGFVSGSLGLCMMLWPEAFAVLGVCAAALWVGVAALDFWLRRRLRSL